MKLTPIFADSTHALLCEDGSTVQLDNLVELVVIELKGHGHFGNIILHISSGDWTAIHHALRELFLLPAEARMLSQLARNPGTMCGGRTRNLGRFRPWLLERVERQTTDLYRPASSAASKCLLSRSGPWNSGLPSRLSAFWPRAGSHCRPVGRPDTDRTG